MDDCINCEFLEKCWEGEKKYEISRFSDFCNTAYIKGTTKVYTGFTF